MTKIKQETQTMEARYRRAQTLLQGFWTRNITPNSTVFPIWIEGSDCFWYQRRSQQGKEYRLVNASTASNSTAFDHQALAGALAEAIKQDVITNNLPITKVDITLGQSTSSGEKVKEVRFNAFDQRWIFNTTTHTCSTLEAARSIHEVISPDGCKLVFERNNNLWLRDLENQQEHALTEDGELYFVYGASGDGWGLSRKHIDGLQVLWSSDSKKLFTVQRDTRQVKDLPVLEHMPQDGSLRPQVKQIKIALSGDAQVPEYRLLAIDIETGTIQDANYGRIPVARNGWGFFWAKLGWWASDNRRTYFVDQSRDYKAMRVMEFDTETGATRILFEENAETHIDISFDSESPPPFFAIPETNELVWWSERSGWAHLYLYDLETGTLKHPITQGDWQVRDVVSFDHQRREVFAQTAGRVPNRDPYYRDLVRICIDTGEITTLAASDHEYLVCAQEKTQNVAMARGFGWDVSAALGIAPSGNFAVVTRSRADEIPVSYLLDRNGDEILTLETADLSVLSAALPNGWQWPEPVKLLAADGETDIYGLVFRPSDFSPEQSYPVISHTFNTPEITWVSKGSFTNGAIFGWPYLDAAALAELGFIVVQIDGRGTCARHKAFHDESYGAISSASKLEDHIAGIRQLAERYPYIDLNRVGIHSLAGGPGAIYGLLQYPDFYKVGVSAMLHDSRLAPATMWGDKYEGISGPVAGHQYPEDIAKNLRGKLFLTFGMREIVNPPALIFRLIKALQQANKDFELMLMPTSAHAVSGYEIRRAWDFLVKHLLAAEPPKEFKLLRATEVPSEAS